MKTNSHHLSLITIIFCFICQRSAAFSYNVKNPSATFSRVCGGVSSNSALDMYDDEMSEEYLFSGGSS